MARNIISIFYRKDHKIMDRIKIMLAGYNGRMGRNIINAAEGQDNLLLTVGIDINPAPINLTFPVFTSPSDYGGKVDVILDFTWHSSIDIILEYALKTNTRLVIATTGHTEEEKTLISEAAKKISIFMSANMSLGVNLVVDLAKKAAATIGSSYDIEIVEKHHNQKMDAPSGTALMIADEISKSLAYTPEYKYDRHPERKKRSKNEIGLHSIRGGTIIGEHEIIFAGKDEVITISHSAISKDMFSAGALEAVRFIYGVKENRLYGMKDLINSK